MAVIQTTISPREIITGETLKYKRHMEIPIGQYFQIHEEQTPRNSTRPLTRGDIFMVPSGNKQVEFKFMTLGSVKKVVRQSWYEIPMPDIFIAQLNALVQGETNDIDFLYRKNRPIGELQIAVVDDEETEAPHIEMIEPETDIDPIQAGK